MRSSPKSNAEILEFYLCWDNPTLKEDQEILGTPLPSQTWPEHTGI